MKLLKTERVMCDCTECPYNIRMPYELDPELPHNVCDLMINPDKPGYSRPIPDVSKIPYWCPLEDI